MKLLNTEWRGRINHWLRTLTEDFYEPIGEIAWEKYQTAEHLTENQVMARDFEPVEPGFTWGSYFEYCWFKGKVTVPESAKGERIVMDLHPDGETTIYVDGQPFGTYRIKGFAKNWVYFVDNVLTLSAQGGESYDILLETYAGNDWPKGKIGPVLSEEKWQQRPKAPGKRRTLGTCTFGIFNEDAYQLYLDANTLFDLYDMLDENSLRAMEIGKGLKKFTQIVNFEQPREKRLECYREAREVLKPLLQAHNGSTAPKCFAVGHSHLDLAWTWPLAETMRKTARTFVPQLRLMEQYPEYKFQHPQPVSYEMCRRRFPKVFEKIQAAVKRGQWIPDGATWVENDLNVPCGEALIRQFVHGKRYFKEYFDVDSQGLWPVDTFGFSGALPQIMQGCGVKYLVTQKMFWTDNEWDETPYHHFYWEGIDGSKVATYFCYVPFDAEPHEIQKTWNDHGEADADAFILPHGYCDGGGGPSRESVEYVRREKDLEGLPKVEYKDPLDFFKYMEELGAPEHTYVGEMYLCVHRGTLTAQGLIKRYNREAEIALREMELWSCLAMEKGLQYDLKRADEIWKLLLLYQFHDTLSGSCMESVNRRIEKDLAGVIADAKAMGDDAVNTLVRREGQGVTLFNSLSFERKELVTLPDAFAEGAVTLEGKAVACEKTKEGVKALVDLPACGAVSLVPAAKACGTASTSHSACAQPGEASSVQHASIREDADGFTLENSKVLLRINRWGELVSYRRKDSSREFVGAASNRFQIYKHIPKDCDIWDFDVTLIEEQPESAADISVSAVEEGMEAVLKVTGRINESAYTQHIRLAAESDRVLFDTVIDWKELHKVLKVDFHSEVYANNAINEIQFGYIERPTHRSRLADRDRFEVANQRYTALCDGTHGVAVLNDCKYGISMKEKTLSLTLLTAGASPEFRADNHEHHFTYAFTGWEGGFVECDVARQAQALNVKPLLTEGVTESFSALSIDRENVFLEAMKPAEDGSGDVILRLYEGKKASGKARITCGLAAGRKAYLCDMLENVKEEIPVENGGFTLDFGVFEIKTVRLSKGK